ncbi:hypothetical protein DPMN_069065 [Dreissena polymorpha]|uniref:Uncharacterized protein n=1 Tax=Dreissena polymorpha TaxID=45954 RepID=A0A9D3Z2B7_DREPO|nr:hypothetical protein DPMN_069065 [Dreissena polymorpha]
MLRYSTDATVSDTWLEVNTCWKWVTGMAVNDAKSRLRHIDILGTTTSGRLG